MPRQANLRTRSEGEPTASNIHGAGTVPRRDLHGWAEDARPFGITCAGRIGRTQERP